MINHHTRGIAICFVTIFFALGCGDDSPTNGTDGSPKMTPQDAGGKGDVNNKTNSGTGGAPKGGGGAPGGKAMGDKAETGLPVAFALPRVVVLGAVASRSMIVEAVYGASQLSGGAAVGRVVSTGTITVGPSGAQYQPTPTDKLIVKMNGQTHEFIMKQASGNQQAIDASTWLASPHVLEYTHRLGKEAEAAIAVQFNGTKFQVKITGWTMMHGKKYDVNMAAAGQTSGSGGVDGQEMQTQYTLTGTIKGEGIEVDVNEQHTSVMASATSLRLLPSQRGSASRFNAVIQSTLRCDGDTYKFEGVKVQADQKDKGQQHTASTETAGNISKNGKAFASCSAKGGVNIAAAGNKVIRLDAPN